MMDYAIRIARVGGPEVMRWEPVELPPPGPGQVRVRNRAVGLNYIDTYHRSGLYPLPLPSGLGMEGSGVVTAVGADVDDFAVGDRVAYCSAGVGSYATAVNLPAARLVALPDAIDFETAAAIMLKGHARWAPWAVRRRSHGPWRTATPRSSIPPVNLWSIVCATSPAATDSCRWFTTALAPVPFCSLLICCGHVDCW